MAADKQSPDFFDVQSGSSSSAPRLPGSQSRTYTVVAGDSLSKIAKRVYGDPRKWRVIYEANRNLIKSPDLIHPGQIFTLPEA